MIIIEGYYLDLTLLVMLDIIENMSMGRASHHGIWFGCVASDQNIPLTYHDLPRVCLGLLFE